MAADCRAADRTAADCVSSAGPTAGGRPSDILELLARRGAAAYLGEPVTLLEHSLQCAALAEAAGGEAELVAACLLHDLGWLLRSPDGCFDRELPSTVRPAPAGAAATGPAGPAGGREARRRAEQAGHDHARRGASFLALVFPDAVHEPVRLHVEAKRWLVARDPAALEQLSPESRRTLVLQGGPLRPVEAAAFEQLAYSAAALRLRHHDDEAKVPGRRCPPLGAYVEMLDELALDKAPREAR